MLRPQQLVGLLDRVFTEFDALTDRYQLEKIKTIGDAYMVAGGVPTRRADPVTSDQKLVGLIDPGHLDAHQFGSDHDRVNAVRADPVQPLEPRERPAFG